MHQSCDGCRTDAEIGVEYDVILISHGKNKPLDKLYWELARMRSFFDVIALNIRDIPDV